MYLQAGCTYAIRSLATACRNEIEVLCGKLINAILFGKCIKRMKLQIVCDEFDARLEPFDIYTEWLLT